MSVPSRDLYQRPDYDPQKRWYDEACVTASAANEAVIEQIRLVQEVHALKAELQAARCTVEQIGDLSSVDLARIGRELRAKLNTITAELRRRHWPVAELP